MRIIAVIQARMGSSRLSGKVLMPILGKPMLLQMVERVRRATVIDEVIVATSVEPFDDCVAREMRKAGVACHRGSLDNVLERFCQVADLFGPVDAVMRLTGDCPLIDWRILDDLVRLFQQSSADYASNVHPPTFPDGLDAEIFTFSALQEACKNASTAYECEHVTPYFYSSSDRFATANLKCREGDFSGQRWTVDEPNDFEKVKLVFEALAADTPDFHMADIQNWLSLHPDIDHLNQEFMRNEGARKQGQVS